MPQLQPGDTAPDFTLPDATATPVALRDLGPGRVILYFYPAALTPGCTTEAIDFSAAAPAFHAAGYRIVGVSPDEPAKLARFIEKEDLAITLLADPDHSTIDAYGAWGFRQIWGKAVEGVIRSTFVLAVDAQGHATVERAYYAVRATGHVERLRQDLGIA
jgi:peroxiredoxin Q/BCP